MQDSFIGRVFIEYLLCTLLPAGTAAWMGYRCSHEPTVVSKGRKGWEHGFRRKASGDCPGSLQRQIFSSKTEQCRGKWTASHPRDGRPRGWLRDSGPRMGGDTGEMQLGVLTGWGRKALKGWVRGGGGHMGQGQGGREFNIRRIPQEHSPCQEVTHSSWLTCPFCTWETEAGGTRRVGAPLGLEMAFWMAGLRAANLTQGS